MVTKKFCNSKWLQMHESKNSCEAELTSAKTECENSEFFDNRIWLNTKEAAEYLRTTPKQLRKWVYQGRVSSYKLLGKSLRFRKSELDLLFKGGLKWV